MLDLKKIRKKDKKQRENAERISCTILKAHRHIYGGLDVLGQPEGGFGLRHVWETGNSSVPRL